MPGYLQRPSLHRGDCRLQTDRHTHRHSRRRSEQLHFRRIHNRKLVQLQLNATGSVLSMTQLYNAPGGIIAVELGPNEKLYFTTPDTIYTYDLPARPVANAADPSLVILAIIVVIAAALLVVYTTLHYRRRRLQPLEHASTEMPS